MGDRYSNPDSPDFDFSSLSGSYTPPLYESTPIPKIAHFIYTSGKPISWLQWLAIRGALMNLGVEKVLLWLPSETETEGAIWKRVEAMERVEIIRIRMPEKVYGHEIPEKSRSDVLRLKILWEVGGIFLENDLVALKSSNEILHADDATSTIMARRINPEGIPNWMIMSKPGSPFLRRYMEKFEGEWDLSKDESTWKDNSWSLMAVDTPSELAKNGDPDLMVLDGHSWFYPLASDPEGDVTLKKLWFGKTWDSIDESYGTHVWHWNGEIREWASPEIVRTIDTPLFCRLRSLFDDLNGDGYIAMTAQQNSNCTSTTTKSLKTRHHRLFSDYRMVNDEHDAKWVDSSGYHHHGWAPTGTSLRQDSSSGPHRRIGEKSFAVLPVPVGWDSREWTVRMDLQLDPGTLDGKELVGLFKIRTEDDGDIVVRVGNQEDAGYVLDVELRDLSRKKAKSVLTEKTHQSRGCIKAPDLRSLESSWHQLAVTFDQRETGVVALYLDGHSLGTESLQLQKQPKLGQEVWLNAREWNELDMGFRGSLRRFTMYADALTVDNVNQSMPISATALSFPTLGLHHVRVTKSQGSLMFILVAIMAISLFLARSRRGVVREGVWYARTGIRYIRQQLRMRMKI